jgi:hypothetical protein
MYLYIYMAETSYYIMLDGNKDVFGQKMIKDKDNNLYGIGFSASTEINIQNKIFSRNSSPTASFVVKFDIFGTLLWFNWITNFDKDNYVKLYGITSDNNDDIYITGHTNSQSIIINNKSYDKKDDTKGSFIIKFNEYGEVIWNEWIDSENNDLNYSIACDSLNNLYIVGKTNSNKINNITKPTIMPTVTTKPSNDFNNYSGYLMKMNSTDKNIEWIKWVDGLENDETTSLVIDSLDNIFIAGNSHSSTLTIDNKQIVKNNNKAVYLAKFDKEGINKEFKWVDGDSSLHATSLKCDTFNNIYLLGSNKSKNIIIDNTTYSQLNNIAAPFIVKFNNNLNVEWAKIIEGTDINYANAINTDNNNNLYMSGTTLSKNIIIDELQYKNISDNTNSYLIKINHKGEVDWFRWFENYENNITTFVKDIFIDKHNFIYLNNYTNGTNIYFNNNYISLINNNLYKIFILKYDLNDILNEDNIYYVIVNSKENYNRYNIFYFILFVVYIYAIWLLYKTTN